LQEGADRFPIAARSDDKWKNARAAEGSSGSTASYAAIALEIGWAKQHVTPTTFLPATMAFKSSMEVSLFAGISNRVTDLQCGARSEAIM
jgi:hypothetical protein